MGSFSFTEFTSKNINMLNPTVVQTVMYLYTSVWKKFHMEILYNQGSTSWAHESFQFYSNSRFFYCLQNQPYPCNFYMLLLRFLFLCFQ